MILGWLLQARTKGASHVLIVHDSYDRDDGDYPVSVSMGKDPREIAKEYSIDGQRVMECYALHLDLETQLAEPRAHHYEMSPAT